MRKTAVTLLVPLALALGACNSGSHSSSANGQEAAPQAAALANEVSGTVSVKAGEAQPSTNATLKLTLKDLSQGRGVVIAQKTINPIGPAPVSFKLPVDTARIVPGDVVILIAEIVDGPRHYTMPLQKAVLTHDGPSVVAIELVGQPTKGEEMLVAYRYAQARLGDLEVSSGKSRGDDGSRAWQAFKKNDHLEWVKDIEKNFDTDITVKTDYAFKEGKAWVVERHYPDRTVRVAWDENGKLVVHEVEVDGKTKPLPVDKAKALRADAERIFGEAG